MRALVAAAVCMPGVASAKFAPVDAQALKLSVVEERAGGRFTSERRIVFRKAATGYTADLTVVATGATGGQPEVGAMARRVLGALVGRTIRYTLDDAGTVVSVADQDALIATIVKAFETMAAGKGAPAERQPIAERTAAALRALPPEAQTQLLASLLSPAIGGKLTDLPPGDGPITLPAGAPTGQRVQLPGRQQVVRGATGRLVIDTVASGAASADAAGPMMRIVQHREIDLATGLILISERRTDTWLASRPEEIGTSRTVATLSPVL